MVKNLTAMPETQLRSLVREDRLEKRMATGSSILPWRLPWTDEPGGLQSMQESDTAAGLTHGKIYERPFCVLGFCFVFYCLSVR